MGEREKERKKWARERHINKFCHPKKALNKGVVVVATLHGHQEPHKERKSNTVACFSNDLSCCYSGRKKVERRKTSTMQTVIGHASECAEKISGFVVICRKHELPFDAQSLRHIL